MLPGPAHFLMRVSALPMASSGVGQERARVPRLRDVQSISYNILFAIGTKEQKAFPDMCASANQPVPQTTREDQAAVGLAGLK